MSDVRPPSGTQWTLSAHDQELVVVESGGGIRSYRAGGRDVLFGYDQDAKCDAGRGQHLIPWPNRIRDGVYTFADKKQQLPLTEPARNNASHGLTRWANWHLVEQSGDRLVVGYQLLPQPGWDGILDLTITYELTGEGLVVTPAATNAGSAAVPFGYGAHPYLTAGEESVDELRLALPAATVLEVDDRLIPTGTAPVPSEFDFRSPRPIGATQFDHAFTDLAADGEADGARWTITVAAGGRVSSVWADAAAYPYAQVFTGDSLPGGRSRRTGVAVEPMTCPANAFATGAALVLEPGATWSASWGVTSDDAAGE